MNKNRLKMARMAGVEREFRTSARRILSSGAAFYASSGLYGV